MGISVLQQVVGPRMLKLVVKDDGKHDMLRAYSIPRGDLDTRYALKE